MPTKMDTWIGVVQLNRSLNLGGDSLGATHTLHHMSKPHHKPSSPQTSSASAYYPTSGSFSIPNASIRVKRGAPDAS